MSRQTNSPGYSYLEFLGSEQAQSTFRLSQRIMTYLREYLNEQGFVEFLPPVISSVTDPGLSGAERVSVSLYNQKAYITSSMVFHKQVLATAFGSIYSFAPNVRLEPETNVQTGRHLVEFCQLDLEQAGASLEESMTLAEDMLVYTISEIALHCKHELSSLGRRLKVPSTPFARYSYDQLFRLAATMGPEIKYGEELPNSVESAVAAETGSFFWITGYPKESRSFYYRESSDSSSVNSMDLIYPEGFGEAISGGEREYRSEVILRRIHEAELDETEFQQFLDMARAGLKPTSGFGIGVERLVRYLSGIRDIRCVRPFPKTPGQIEL